MEGGWQHRCSGFIVCDIVVWCYEGMRCYVMRCYMLYWYGRRTDHILFTPSICSWYLLQVFVHGITGTLSSPVGTWTDAGSEVYLRCRVIFRRWLNSYMLHSFHHSLSKFSLSNLFFAFISETFRKPTYNGIETLHNSESKDEAKG